eukprot:7891276-Pyramimonas_sp.AAC.1
MMANVEGQEGVNWPATREGKFGKDLEFALAQSEIDPRGNVAQKMMNSLSKEEKTEFKKKPVPEKIAYRKDWAEKQFKPLVE